MLRVTSRSCRKKSLKNFSDESLFVSHITIRDSNRDRKRISFDEGWAYQIPLMYSKNGQTSDICEATR